MSDSTLKSEVGALLTEFSRETSIHGISQTISNHPVIVRILWLATVLFMSAFFGTSAISAITYYHTYGTNLDIKMATDRNITFPATTFSSIRSIKKDQIGNIAAQLNVSSSVVEAVIENRTKLHSSMGTGGKHYIRKFQRYYQELHVGGRQAIGLEYADLFTDCLWRKSRRCTEADFTRVYWSREGVCYTFSHWTKPKRTNGPGQFQGLMVEVNSKVLRGKYGNPSYLRENPLAFEEGLKIFVHHSNFMPLIVKAVSLNLASFAAYSNFIISEDRG